MILKELLDVFHAQSIASQAFSNSHTASLIRLRNLLKHEWRTSFGRQHRLRADMGINEFRSAVPIRDYVDYGPWISRIRGGESDVLWPGKPIAFATTSGTTGDDKLIPITEQFLHDYHLGSVLTFTRMTLNAPSMILGRILTLGGPSEESNLSGIPVGSITGLLYRSFPSVLNSRLAIPPDVHNIGSYSEKLYVIARLALEVPVTAIIAVSPASLLVISDAINSMATEVIEDIANGSLRPLSAAPENLETTLRMRLRPNPSRARELEEALDQDARLLPRRVWPLRAVCTYMKQGHPSQWEAIRQAYGELRIIDPGLVASEGRVSIGLYPDKKHHAVIPVSSFVEFLPVNLTGCEEISDAATLLPDQLEKDHLYTPVISSANGLMRYKLGDVISVNKTVGGVPLIEYEGRLDDSISVAGEKVCDLHFREAIDRLRAIGYAVEGLWAVGIDWAGHKPCYLFLWETADTDESTSNFNHDLERALQDVNVSYRRKREQLLLLPVKAVPVAVGGLLSHNTKIHWLGQAKQRHILPKATSAMR